MGTSRLTNRTCESSTKTTSEPTVTTRTPHGTPCSATDPATAAAGAPTQVSSVTEGGTSSSTAGGPTITSAEASPVSASGPKPERSTRASTCSRSTLTGTGTISPPAPTVVATSWLTKSSSTKRNTQVRFYRCAC